MRQIEVLDSATIDKIAAGEVVERPASIVKELVENAIDAGAHSVTVEIEDGGIRLIRVSDDGSGIPREQVAKAFLRHATSKIRTIDDLIQIHSLGFRGEALSSIAAVAQVELLTKTEEEEYGTRYCIEGGIERKIESAGVRTGSSFYIRNLFYNVPARKKFLKTGMTEAGHVQTVLIHMAMSHPEVSVKLLVNGQEKLHTPGNGDLKTVIYAIHGREVASHLVPIDVSGPHMHITGFLGEPMVSRSNRKLENYYLNGRYFTSSVIAKAIEDAYRPYMMQHQYPFTALLLETNPAEADVNVHPAKMEVRFHKQQEIYKELVSGIGQVLHDHEMLPDILPEPKEKPVSQSVQPTTASIPVRPAPAPTKPIPVQQEPVPAEYASQDPREGYFLEEMRKRVYAYHENKKAQDEKAEGKSVPNEENISNKEMPSNEIIQETPASYGSAESRKESTVSTVPDLKKEEKVSTVPEPKEEQLNLFDEKILTKERRKDFRIIGQVFDTYWIVESEKQMLMIDQHAAHEKVLYEKLYRKMQESSVAVQMISPPILLHLSMQEQAVLQAHQDVFRQNGFEIESFGGDDYAVRGVPMDLSGLAHRDRLMELFDEFADDMSRGGYTSGVEHRLATMACKAAVKGEHRLSVMEMEALLDELLNSENPYHCPHGRPTMITRTRDELEKRFKRIV